MESFLINIHNIDNTFASDHDDHYTDEVTCVRPNIFDKTGYEAAQLTYKQRLAEYNKTNWLKRLFISKPLEPTPEEFVS